MSRWWTEIEDFLENPDTAIREIREEWGDALIWHFFTWGFAVLIVCLFVLVWLLKGG